MSEILPLPISHTRTSPVFVIGSARSGTSLLTWLIRRYLKISFGSESQFLVRFYRRLPDYGNLENDGNLRRLIGDIARERCFNRWSRRFGFRLDRCRLFERAASGPRSYARVLNAIFGELADHHGMSRWGDKTPEYNNDLPILLSLFPDAQFVHIIRDGRDVALSALEMHFGAGNMYRAAIEWRQTILRIGHFAASLPSQQLLTLHYERLLSEPAATLARLSDFLGVVRSDAILAAIGTDITSHVRSGNGGKWITRLSPAQRRLFETVAGEQLALAGYPTGHAAGGRISTAERLYWETDHLVRKALRQKYWSDHAYRTGLRVRMDKRRWVPG